jgi:putative ABC transport system permease protein
MFKSYLKMTWRNILRHKGYSLINITGLAVGMACCILIIMYVTEELGFDGFHEKGSRIFRANTISSVGSNTRSFAVVPAVFTEGIAESMPEVEAWTRVIQFGSPQMRHENNTYELSDQILVDPAFFEIFTFPFIAGDPSTALDDPDALVITEELAVRIFGRRDPIGETLFPAGVGAPQKPMRIAGVIQDVPKNSNLQFKAVSPLSTFQYMAGTEGPPPALLDPYYCRLGGYFLFKQDIDAEAMSEKIDAVAQAKWGEVYRSRSTTRQFFLLNIRDIHLRSPNQDEPGPAGDINTVYLFAAIALLVLLIACFNFINLSTAKSANRAREVGIRKVIGSQKKQLIHQFLFESVLLSLIGLGIGLLLVMTALPVFNSLVGKEMEISEVLKGPVILTMIGIVVLTGLVAGSFPAFVLSAFDPVSVLKGRLSSASRNSALRKILVAFQFSITIFLIVGVLTVIRQLDYMKNKDLGFDKQQLAVIDSLGDDSDTLRERILQDPNITAVTFSRNVPGVFIQYFPLTPSTGDPSRTGERVELLRVGYDFCETYGMEIVQGRDFSRDFATDDEQSVIINEKAAEIFGWKDDAIGKILYDPSDDNRPYTVVGVVRDFHQATLLQEIGPVILDVDPTLFRYVSVRIRPGSIPETLVFLEGLFREIRPDREFTYYFIDEAFRRMYPEAEQFRKLYTAFGVLAVFIACLGLFGLSSFATTQRTKEIGVRKILGASWGEIVTMLSKEFVVLVLAANILAWPLAFFIMRGWIQRFAYRIPIGWDLFVISALITIVITLITISYQSVKSALANPADSLRYE